MRARHRHYIAPVSQADGFGDLWTPPSQPCDTSEDAAIAIQPHLNGLRAKVLAFIEARGAFGATDDEIAVGLDMNPSTARPRRIELELVKRIGRRRGVTRPTRSGRQAQVFCAARYLQSSPSCVNCTDPLV